MKCLKENTLITSVLGLVLLSILYRLAIVRIVAPLTISDFIFDWHDGRTINKIVHYFLLERIDELEPVANREDNEDFENTWLTAKDAYSALSFDDMKAALKKAIDIIKITEHYINLNEILDFYEKYK